MLLRLWAPSVLGLALVVAWRVVFEWHGVGGLFVSIVVMAKVLEWQKRYQKGIGRQYMDLLLGLVVKARMPYVGFVGYINSLMCENGNEA